MYYYPTATGTASTWVHTRPGHAGEKLPERRHIELPLFRKCRVRRARHDLDRGVRRQARKVPIGLRRRLIKRAAGTRRRNQDARQGLGQHLTRILSRKRDRLIDKRVTRSL